MKTWNSCKSLFQLHKWKVRYYSKFFGIYYCDFGLENNIETEFYYKGGGS